MNARATTSARTSGRMRKLNGEQDMTRKHMDMLNDAFSRQDRGWIPLWKYSKNRINHGLM